MNFEEFNLNALSKREYQVSGKMQIRFETLFTENDTSCVARCSEKDGGKVGVEIKDFKQTSDALIDTLSADLTAAIEKLLLQLGERETLLNILNMEEILEGWKLKKALLVEKHSDIPDFDSICDNFGDNLKNEEKLLSSIRDKGIYGLLFPQLKHFAYGKLPVEFTRQKTIKESVLSKDLPIAENIVVGEAENNYTFEVKGELDRDNFDYPGFLNVSRQMFGGQVTAEDISFQSTENYLLDKRTMQYAGGARRHYFEIKGSYFRDDKQEFKLKD